MISFYIMAASLVQNLTHIACKIFVLHTSKCNPFRKVIFSAEMIFWATASWLTTEANASSSHWVKYSY